jgi:hypothetical protein
MEEPPLVNYSPFAASVLPLLDRHGVDCLVAVVKATYEVRHKGDPLLHEERRPIRAADQMWGAADIPDIRYPSDFSVRKPGTDVVVVAEACAPHERPVRSLDVTIEVSNRKKTLRVFGKRVWQKSIMHLKPSVPEPFVRERLSWGNAFGGLDASDPNRVVEEPRNPVGRGIVREPRTLADQLVASVEDPRTLISSPSTRPVPAGCSAIGRNFAPRRSFAGTYDAEWLRTTYPARPLDYDERHEQFATPDLVFSQALRGGEPVRLSNVSHDGPIAFTIPRSYIVLEAVIDGETVGDRPHLDTVLIDTTARTLELTWRASFPRPPSIERVNLVRVTAKEFS